MGGSDPLNNLKGVWVCMLKTYMPSNHTRKQMLKFINYTSQVQLTLIIPTWCILHVPIYTCFLHMHFFDMICSIYATTYISTHPGPSSMTGPEGASWTVFLWKRPHEHIPSHTIHIYGDPSKNALALVFGLDFYRNGDIIHVYYIEHITNHTFLPTYL